MTPSLFRNTAPFLGQITLLRNDLNNMVTAINIHRSDCSFTSYDSSLGKLVGLTLNLSSDISVVVNDVTKLGTYYHLSIDPVEIPDVVNEEVCFGVKLDPTDELISIDFRNSVFNPVYNNVPETLTGVAETSLYRGRENNKRGKSIQDVDRKNDAIIPTNINQLLSGSANLAEFPISNYSSLANTTGRYLGSKTSVQDYGTIPALGLIQVDGSISIPTVTNESICSQSLSDLTITEVSFNSTYNTKPSSNLIPTSSIGGVDGFINGTSNSFASIDSMQTEMEFTIPNGNVYKLRPGSIVQLTNNTKVDYVEVIKVTVVGPQIGWNRTILNVSVTRGVDGTSTAMNGVFNAPGSGQYEIISLRFVDSDTLYTYEGNKPITLSNKKVYFPASGEIYKVGPKGRILYGVGSCN